MEDDVKNSGIKKQEVTDFFNQSANEHKNYNAVLDTSNSPNAIHSNIYRDYYTKCYMLESIQPQKEDELLDFGCGVGRITYFFSNRVGRISGVDSSEKMLEVAKGELKKGKNVDFELLSGTELIYSLDSFNKIFSNWVLQHISDEDILKYLAEFRRILKPKGKIYLFEQTMTNTQASGKHIYRRTEDYCRLIESVGFKKISVKPVMRVPSRGMSIWNKKIFPGKMLLPLLKFIDKTTMTRKPQFVKYYTTAFIYQK